jgi:hypothetical protein
MSRDVAAAAPAPAPATLDDSTLASALCSYFRDSREEAEADPLQARALQSGMLCSELSDNACSLLLPAPRACGWRATHWRPSL